MPQMHKTFLFMFFAFISVLLVSCRGGCAPGGLKASSAFQLEPPPQVIEQIKRSLRPETFGTIERQLKLKSLEELPFYDMRLKLFPQEARLEGEYQLYFFNRTSRELEKIPLLLHPNTPRELGSQDAATSAELVLKNVKRVNGPKVKMEKKRLTVVELHFSPPLKPQERVLLEVSFEGTLKRLPSGSNDVFNQAFASLGMSGAGMGPSDYGLLALGDGLMTIASAYPMVAPFRRGTFDVSRPSRFGDLAYNDLANFRVEVVVPQTYSIITNLADDPHKSMVKGKAGWIRYTALGAANRDFVLVASPNLKRRTQTLGPIKVTSAFLKGDLRGGKLALKIAKQSLEFYEKRFGEYPYTEMDVAEATLVGGAGGVEFPGMILMAGMLYRPPSKSTNPLALLFKMTSKLTSSLGAVFQSLGQAGQGAGLGAASPQKRMDRLMEQLMIFTVAHEIAHQYFAGLVGSDCRNDPAVDEPLAQFAAGEFIQNLLGAKAGKKQMDNNVKMNYGIYRMLGGDDLPAAQAVRNFPSALAYAAIIYGKAPYFYHALKRKLGDKRFNEALRKAVATHRFQLVDLKEWIKTLERTSGGTGSGVTPLARRWFYETHGDEDLNVDDSGDAVLESLLGKKQVRQLKRSLAFLGMSPRDLFRMFLRNMQ